MRTIRALTIAAAIVAALPSISSAQTGRGFTDSWFWGVKAGGLTLADSAGSYRQAGLAGVDWLITRTRGGLYISGSEAFFTSQAFVAPDPVNPDTGTRVVNTHNMRKLDVAAVGFPGEHLLFHPYVGIGFTMGAITNAVAQGPFTAVDQVTFANQQIQSTKVAFYPLLIAGGQYRFSWASAFGQATMNLVHQGFLMYNGRPYNFTYEFGLRYNVGNAIDRTN